MPRYRVIFDTGEEKMLDSARHEFGGGFVSFFGESDGELALVASYPADGIVAIELEGAAINTSMAAPTQGIPVGARADSTRRLSPIAQQETSSQERWPHMGEGEPQ
jgi:hypothetical protein